MGVKHQVNDAKKFNLFLLYVGWEEEKKIQWSRNLMSEFLMNSNFLIPFFCTKFKIPIILSDLC